MVVSWVGACVPALQEQMQTMDNERIPENRANAYMTTQTFPESEPHLLENAKNESKWESRSSALIRLNCTPPRRYCKAGAASAIEERSVLLS
jgi:hypothetical protein